MYISYIWGLSDEIHVQFQAPEMIFQIHVQITVSQTRGNHEFGNRGRVGLGHGQCHSQNSVLYSIGIVLITYIIGLITRVISLVACMNVLVACIIVLVT